MSLLYSPSFKYLEGDLKKNQEIFMDSSPRYHHYHHQPQNNYQQQQHNSGLMRYRSAPSSFFDNLIDDSSTGGNITEGYPYFRSSSPEIDNFLDKYMLPCNNNGSGDLGGSHDLQEFAEKSMKQEDVEIPTTATTIPQQNTYSNGSSQIMYQSLQVQDLGNGNNNNNNNNSMQCSSFGAGNSMVLENSMQAKMASGNGSNLIRQNSSPAGLFSNLGIDNGFAVMRDVGSSGPSTSRLHNHINFSSGPSSRLTPQIAEIGSLNMGTRGSEKGLGSNAGSNRQYISNFRSDFWDDISFNGQKRAKENDGNMFFDLNTLDSQNGNSGSRSNGLTHHLSLPKTSSEMTAVDKFLHFQGSIPCKIRAKRGFATHPRSIAERVRRTRISERMRKLQDLFPDMDKQANTADMLDLAVEYIKDLQKQVKTLTDTKEKCMCSSKH